MTAAMKVFAGVAQRRAEKRTIVGTASATVVLVANTLVGSHLVYAQATGQIAQTSELEEIQVTGTRIVRNGYEAPTPVTVLTTEDINRDAPVNIADFVNKLPQFANSPSARNSSTSGGDPTGGVNNLNLRELGSNRTLVLLDGVRVVAASVSGFYNNGGAVDINVVPDFLVSRVDVVTGGASAAYGSDALAGVVNFILDKNFTGVKGTVEGGATSYGDDGQYKASLAAGTGFADGRGHFLISGSIDHTDGIPNAGKARPWVAKNYCQITNPAYNGTNGQPFYLIEPNCGSALYTPGGLISGGPLNGTDFGPGGVPRQFNYSALNDGFEMSGGGDVGEAPGAILSTIVGPDTGLDTRLDRQSLFTRASYDITNDTQIYLQFDVTATHALDYCCVTTGNSINITSDNPFIPASIQARMAADGISSFQMNTYNTAFGVQGGDNYRKFYQYLIGANGKFDAFGSRWTWEAYATQSKSDTSISTTNNYRLDLFQLATDVVTNPATGLPICRSTLTNPGNGCVPYNPMGVGVNSQAALDYVEGNGHLDQYLTEDVASATLRGAPFSTWAGPVSVALGVEHRNESVTGATDAADQANDFFGGDLKATFGSYHINEGFLETVVPLAKDASWAKSLDLNGAVRETDYSTSGRVTTWKVGATYAPFSDVRLRATRSRDIRSPNLGEYFAGGLTGTGTVVDPFKGNQVVPEVDSRIGNPALRPESADTTGAGIVYQPSWLRGLSASFDYYKIDIKQAIAILEQQAELDACYTGNQAFCSFIHRDAQGNITTIYIEPANTAFARTSGFDIEASYAKRLSEIVNGWKGTVSARMLATHVMDLTTVTPDGQVLQGAGVGSGLLQVPIAPKWRYNVTLAYDNDAFSASWTGRGFNATVQSSQYTQCTSACPPAVAPGFTINDNHLPGKFYMDMSFTYHLKGSDSSSADLFLSIENVADNNPDNIAFLFFAPGLYDMLGRTFRAGVRFKM